VVLRSEGLRGAGGFYGSARSLFARWGTLRRRRSQPGGGRIKLGRGGRDNNARTALLAKSHRAARRGGAGRMRWRSGSRRLARHRPDGTLSTARRELTSCFWAAGG